MVNGFTFHNTPFVEFGLDKLKKLPDVVSGISNNVLIITGSSSFRNSGHWPWLMNQMAERKIVVSEAIVSGEPSPDIVDKIVNAHRERKIGAVVSIGGGSVLDAGKAVSAMLTKEESVLNYLEGVGDKKHDGKKISFIAIPTTSGTGSEATSNAVLSRIGEKGFKKSLRHPQFIPDIAIIDPGLVISCPQQLTKTSGMDAFTQLVEAYLSEKASVIIESLAYKAIACVKDYFIKAVRDGSDKEARSGMAYAAFVSGVALTNAGLGVVHGFASPIGGFFDIPHGVVCGTLMAPANRVNIERLLKQGDNHYTIDKYSKLGRLFAEEGMKGDDEYYCKLFIDKLEEWTEQLNVPLLSDYGISNGDIDKIVEKTGIKNNPVKLDKQDLKEILSSRIHN